MLLDLRSHHTPFPSQLDRFTPPPPPFPPQKLDTSISSAEYTCGSKRVTNRPGGDIELETDMVSIFQVDGREERGKKIKK